MNWFKKSAAVLALCVSAPSAHAATANDFDVLFMMDSSGSLGSSGWASLKAFVVGAISNYVDPTNTDNRVGVISFSNGAQTIWDFTDFQNTAAINSTVSALPHLSSVTHTRTALIDGIGIYTSQSVEPRSRVAFLITDGLPVPSASQNPCSLEPQLLANDIELNIIGVGSGWNPQNLSCLVDDPANTGQIFEIADFNSGDAADIFAQTLTPTAVPLPASLPLMLAGFGAFAWVRRRQAA